MILQRNPDAKEIHLINDRYDVDMSVKRAEHKKRSAMYEGGLEIYFRKTIKVFHLPTHLMHFLQIQETKYASKNFFKLNSKD